MPLDPARTKAIDTAITAIERQYGKGSIMRMDGKERPKVASISTGSIGLDVALGIGGMPQGRICEVYGAESSGKTTLTLHIIAEAQRKGQVAAFIDAEHALDLQYAEALGVEVDELLISQPDFGEQALEIAETLVRSNAVGVIVIDSVAALVPKAELEGDMGDSLPGLQARLMSQAMRKLTAAVSKSDCLLIFINQVRHKIGVMFGNPEVTSGGNALKFYASVRLDIRRIGSIKQGEEILGNRTRVKVVKNKVAPPFRRAEFDIIYGKGISLTGELVDMGVELELVQRSGSWYSLGDERIGQGRENAKNYLAEHPEAMATLRTAILKHHEIGGTEQGGTEQGGTEQGSTKDEPTQDAAPTTNRKAKNGNKATNGAAASPRA
jgi:recombination protein RecA